MFAFETAIMGTFCCACLFSKLFLARENQNTSVIIFYLHGKYYFI